MATQINLGDIAVDVARKIVLRSGALIDSSTLGPGEAGSVEVKGKEITIERGSNSLILHYASVREAFGPASDEVHEVGALYGRSLNRGLWRVQGAVGLARLAGFECLEVEDPDDCDATGTFGFPASLELTVRPLPFLGVGVHAFATVSPDGAWGGVGLVGHLGILR